MIRVAGLVLLLSALVSTSGSATVWEPDQVEVSAALESTALLGLSGRAASADADDGVHLAFEGTTGEESSQIFYIYRGVAGEWGLPEALTLPGNFRNAAVAVDGDGRVHVVWESWDGTESDIHYRMRDPAGIWQETEILAPAGGLSRDPVNVVDARGDLHVVWTDGRSGRQEILHAVRQEDAWSEVHLLSPGALRPEDPNLAADGVGAVHVVWTEQAPLPNPRLDSDIMYARIVPSTMGQVNPVRLIASESSAQEPFIEATEDGTLHLVWLDDGATSQRTFEVHYRRYLPGIGWGHSKRFSYDGIEQGGVIIEAGPKQSLSVAWEDYRNGNPEIFYRQITPETGWDPRPTRLTQDLSSSLSPAIVTLKSGELVLVWTDALETGQFRVYAKEGQLQAAP